MASTAPKVVTQTSPRLADVVAFPRQELEDAELVARACEGQAWAHEAIYRRHVQRVARIGHRLLRDDAEVDDVVQETFLIAFETLGKLAEPAALRGWLTAIAVHRVHRRFRWHRLTRLWTGAELAASLETQVSPDAGPESRAELARIDRVLRELSLTLRLPWVLRHVLGDSLEEAAAACECSLATVKRRLAKAERHVDAHLKGPER